MSDGAVQRAQASRQHTGSTASTALSPVYEQREICLAYGAQAHPDQMRPAWAVDTYVSSLLGNYPNVERVSEFEYRNHRQRVIYLLRHTTNKNQFRIWLRTPGLHVIYSGHARNGRGPCFGRVDEEKGEVWAEGSDWMSNGMFRMGFPFIGASAGEIVSHGYTAHILKEGDPMPPREDCHPELTPYMGRLELRPPEELAAGLSVHLRGHQTGDRYYCYRKAAGGPWFIIHYAGWDETASSPFDWGSTDINCRVLCHFGCSTFVHNYPVMRRLADWRRSGNERYAYWTSATAVGVTHSRWVANLITYDRENAFASWEGSLESAMQRTNRDLRSGGWAFQLR